MNRRHFFTQMTAGAAGAAAVALVPTSVLPIMDAPYADEFSAKGYLVVWRGWRRTHRPYNHGRGSYAIEYGVWMAVKHPIIQARNHAVATTRKGYVGVVDEHARFDDSLGRGWPASSAVVAMDDQQREALKQRAARDLLEHL